MSTELIGSGFRIAGTGSALPEKVVTNEDVIEMIKAGDHPRKDKANSRWIVINTGIETRYFSNPDNEDETTAGLSIRSGRQALERADFDPESINLVIVATITTDEATPNTSSKVQKALGLSQAEFFDIDLACTGFVRSLSVANALMATHGLRRAMVIGTDRVQEITDYTDLMTAPLFGDASGAVVLDAVDDGRGIVSRAAFDMGEYGEILNAPKGKLVMDGGEVKRVGVEVMTRNAISVLRDAHRTSVDISRIIFHQANIHMIGNVADNLGIQRRDDGSLNTDIVPITIDYAGNSSAGTVGLTLDKSVVERPLEEGEFIILNAVGGGMASEAIGIQA